MTEALMRGKDKAAAPAGVLSAMWSTGAWRMYPLALLYVIGLSLMMNILPGIMADYAAGRRTGQHIRCEDYPPEGQPPACRDAYSDVVKWSSATSCISAVMLFVLAPVVGACSDAWGRRPFLLATATLGCGPPLVLLLHLRAGLPLLLYYPALILAGCVHLRTIALGYLAILLPPVHRASGFGLLMAVFGIGNLIGPLISSMLSATVTACTAVGVRLACIAYVLLLMPSMASAAGANAQQRLGRSKTDVWAHVSGLRILLRTPLLMRLTACLMLSSIVTDGLDDLLVQYFKLRFGIGVDDITAVYVLYGISEVLVQTLVLRHLLKWAGESRVLLAALLASTAQMLLVAFCTSKWQAIGVVLLWTLGDMAFPAISGINANHAAASEQGAIQVARQLRQGSRSRMLFNLLQGAMDGANALAAGVGPLPLAAAFAAFSSSTSSLPYYPGAPFLLAAALLLVAAGCAWGAGNSMTTDNGSSSDSDSLLDPLLADEDAADGGSVQAALDTRVHEPQGLV